MKNFLLMLICVSAVACTSEKITRENTTCYETKIDSVYNPQADPNLSTGEKVKYILAPKVKKTWYDWRNGNEGC